MIEQIEALLGPGIGGIFRQMEWAEEEIASAQARHPAKRQELWDSFTLLRGTHELMGTEFIYRAHVREILERIAKGEDTRPATDAEIACIASEASLRAPLGTAGTAVYIRAFSRAFPEQWKLIGEDAGAYEHVAGTEADMIERRVRRQGAQEWRRPEQRKRLAA